VLLRRLIRVFLSLAAAALAGTAALVIAYAMQPQFTLEMDRPAPRLQSGFYDAERAGDETFAWTRRQATMAMPGLDRRGAWNCVVRLRGGRPHDQPPPEVVFTVDGVIARRHTAGNDFAEVEVPLPPRQGSGATVTLTTPTFVPGSGDKRELGVYVDRFACGPVEGFIPLPPRGALRTAALAGTAFGAVLVVMGAPTLLFAAGIATVSGIQAIPLTRGIGPFSAFAQPIEWFAIVLCLMAIAVLVSARYSGRAFPAAARVALFVTAAVLYLKLAALLHPSKLLVDALFHAHRLEWVLGGNYFFTQPMPSGVRFPYAIGLYVFSMPWSHLTTDFVTLLRVVVTSAEALGGLLLYYVIARSWGDRTVAAVATVLYSVAPTTFEIVGNANLTNAFGQSVSLAALVGATAWPLARGHWRAWIALTLLIAGGLLCHISTLMLLGAILSVLCALYWVAGRPPLKTEAWRLAGSLAVAGILAVLLYYGHFGEAFRSASQVPAATAAGMQVSLPTRMADAVRLLIRSVGWPLLVLAIPGAIVWWRRGWRDRLGLALAALAITCVAITAVTALTPVQQAFYRYALEFITRVTLATYPAMIVWAALGAVWAWRRQGAARLGAVLLVGAAVLVGGDAWMNWMR
jgi:hypothetical protein